MRPPDILVAIALVDRRAAARILRAVKVKGQNAGELEARDPMSTHQDIAGV